MYEKINKTLHGVSFCVRLLKTTQLQRRYCHDYSICWNKSPLWYSSLPTIDQLKTTHIWCHRRRRFPGRCGVNGGSDPKYDEMCRRILNKKQPSAITASIARQVAALSLSRAFQYLRDCIVPDGRKGLVIWWMRMGQHLPRMSSVSRGNGGYSSNALVLPGVRQQFDEASRSVRNLDHPLIFLGGQPNKRSELHKQEYTATFNMVFLILYLLIQVTLWI